MTEADSLDVREPRAEHACYECQNATTLAELEFVDDLIEHSPFFRGVSENFSFCSGDGEFFHDNIVNCCIGCYAQIIEGMVLWDDDGRKREIGKIGHLDLQLAPTSDSKIRIWFKTRPVSRQKKRKASVFQNLCIPGLHD